MLLFEQSDSREPGTWRGCLFEGRRTAFVVCPNCGQRLLLNPHKVAADGSVSPSVVCGRGDHPCTFHDYIQLDDWIA
jgi:hypothetical protein